MIVFIRGISNGSNGLIPRGGHNWPISILGESEEWKYAQKNEKKNKISEIINKIIPKRIPLWTYLVWWPCIVASRVTSRHHWYIQRTVGGIVKITK